MKNFSLFVLLVLSFNIKAFEIHCQTPWQDLLMVLKTSESSNINYLLFLNEDSLEKYWPLNSDSFTNTLDEFSFLDNDTEIHVDKKTGLGEIKATQPLLREESIISLTDCVQKI